MTPMIHYRNETDDSLGILERYAKDPEVQAAATAELNRRNAEVRLREAAAAADVARRKAEAKLCEGLLLAIARRHCSDDIETFAARNSDRLDFREIAIWELGAALQAAFELGRKVERGEPTDQPMPADDGSIRCARCPNPATLTVGDEELCYACAEAQPLKVNQ